jgi:hypothetical protein
MPDAAGLAVDFLGMRSLEEARQFCRDHPEVLSDYVDQALGELERRLGCEGDMGGRDAVRQARDTLAACRRDGLELGFANAELQQAQRQLVAAESRDRAKRLTQVGKAWYGRFEVTGDPADLNHAVDFARQAVETTPGDYAALADLAGVEESRFRKFGEWGDGAHMAEHQQAAVRAGRNAPKRDQYELHVRLAVRLTLWTGLLKQYGFLDEDEAQAEIGIRMMTEAVDAAEASLSLAEPYSRQRYEGLAALIDALHVRYTTLGSLQDLDRAIAAYEELASDWAGTPRALPARRGLARTLHERSKRTDSPDDLRRAVQELSVGLEVTPLDAPDRAAAVADLERWQAQLAAKGR